MTFEETGIRPELVKAVTELGFQNPMPVQEQVIPVILQTNKDIIALAQTGTGKTAAFGLPLLSLTDEKLKQPQVLVLCPTRELCLQIADDLINYSKYIKGLRVVAVYGGASIENQIREIKQGAHIIAATPGRMNDLIRRGKINQIVGYLQTKLTSWAQYKYLWLLQFFIGKAKQWQPKSCSFTSTSLRKSNNVFVRLQNNGDNLFLNRHRVFVSKLGYRFHKLRSDTNFFKCHIYFY